jgi:hypothetical protein
MALKARIARSADTRAEPTRRWHSGPTCPPSHPLGLRPRRPRSLVRGFGNPWGPIVALAQAGFACRSQSAGFGNPLRVPIIA